MGAGIIWGGVSEIQTLAEFKPLFFKDGFPNLDPLYAFLISGKDV